MRVATASLISACAEQAAIRAAQHHLSNLRSETTAGSAPQADDDIVELKLKLDELQEAWGQVRATFLIAVGLELATDTAIEDSADVAFCHGGRRDCCVHLDMREEAVRARLAHRAQIA